MHGKRRANDGLLDLMSIVLTEYTSKFIYFDLSIRFDVTLTCQLDCIINLGAVSYDYSSLLTKCFPARTVGSSDES